MNSSRLTQYLCFAGILLQVVFIWALPVYLTQDGPSHIYNAQLFLNLLGGDALTSGLFEINSAIYPNWTGTLLLSFFLKIFPAVIAEKIWVSLLLTAFIYSSYAVIRQINHDNLYLTLFIIILGQNFFFVYGFHNFILSLAVFNWLVLNYLKKPSKYYLKQTLLLILLFFTHPVAFLLGLVYLGASVLAEELLGAEPGINWKTVMLQLFSMAPSLLFFVAYFIQMDGSGGEPLLVFNLSPMTIIRLTGMAYMDVFEGFEKYIYGLLGLLIFGQLVISARSILRKDSIRQNAGIIAVWICCTIIYFFINDVVAGGSFFARRTTLIFYMATIYLLASTGFYVSFSKYLALFLFLVFCVHLTYRFPKHLTVARMAKQYTLASKVIPDGSTILPLQYSKKGLTEGKNLSPTVSVFSHISGYVAVMSNALTLDNYEANTTYFPIRWKENKNPYAFIDYEDEKDRWNFDLLDLNNYEKTTGVEVDYFLLFGNSEQPPKGTIKSVLELEEIYSNDVVRVFKRP